MAALDLDQRRDWLRLFPFFETRRPGTYDAITAAKPSPEGAGGLP